ncbi:MAG: glycosyltransferase family 4 protein [Armatimonadota bacterium]
MATQPSPSLIRVGLITWSLPGGGIETYLLRLAASLHGLGYAVDVVTTHAPGAWFDRIASTGATPHHLDQPAASSGLQHARTVCQWIADRAYHVIFINSTPYAQAGLSLLPDNMAAIPVLHVDYPRVYETYCADADLWNLAVAVSPRIRDVAQERAPARPVIYIPNGVVIPSEDAQARRAALTSPCHLFYLGRLDQNQKGIYTLPPAIRQCLDRGVDLRVTIAGDGPDRAELERRFRDEGLDGVVSFAGMIPIDQVYTLLHTAHLLIMPSRYEGLPTVLLEAQACGCVPVASRLPGITDVAVEDGVTGVLAPVDDAAAFAEAIIDLCRDPQRWQAMSRAAYQRAKTLFSVEAMGQAYARVIDDAVGGRYPLPGKRSRRFAINLATLGYPVRPKDLLLFVTKWVYRRAVPEFVKQLFRNGCSRLSVRK